MTDDDRFDDLWAAYLEGDLDETGRRELQKLLGDESRMERAVDLYQIHRLLGVLATEIGPQSGMAGVQTASASTDAEAFVAATMARLPADDEGFASAVMGRIGGRLPSALDRAGEFRLGAGRWWPAAMAAVILSGVAATAAFVVYHKSGVASPAQNSSQTTAASASSGESHSVQPLATITRHQFLLLTDHEPPIAVGQPLDRKRVRILAGALEMRLRNGVMIVLEGPGDLELRSDLEAFLHEGSVVVRMPEGTSGFRLGTSTTDVLDLGTEFAVKAKSGFVTDVQVYDGAVIASATSPDAAGRFPTRLEAGEAARFSSQTSVAPQQLSFAEGRFVRRLSDVGIPFHAASRHAEDVRQYGRAKSAAIIVPRTPEPVRVDGRLEEWPVGTGFVATRDGSAHCPEWADGRMMYDDGHLYIAAHVGDPAPMRSTIDPSLDAEDGWRGGAVQVRVSTDREMGWPVNANGPAYFALRNLEPTSEQKAAATNQRLAHLTMWFHAPSQTACLTIAHGMLVNDLSVNPKGFRGSFARDADGKGYILEYAIPWRLLNCAADPPRAGDTLAAAWQVLWSDEGGRLWRDQLIEIRNPDEPWRINVWERGATWGRAEYR